MKQSLILLACCCLAACSETPDESDTAQPGSQDHFANAIRQHVPVLSSDEFAGREPATSGEDKTVTYIREQFQQAGLRPGNGSQWFQPVPITKITPEAANMVVRGSDFEQRLRYHEDIVISTPQQVATTGLSNSELVFVGYGIVAPEYQWDDYAGLDVTGKTVIALVNDPGFANPQGDLFKGRAMTYYGRWTYKFEEAARQGAAGILVVHVEQAAGYPWSVLSSSATPPTNITLTAEDRNRDQSKIQGWIRDASAEQLFSAAGLDFASLAESAAQRGFTPVPLNAVANAKLVAQIQRAKTRNVLGVLRGSQRPDEVIVYTAHWDHLGTADNKEGDSIYNGALDNATGIAGLIALAETFVQAERPPERSVLFLATTAEEAGLLGSQYYVEHPVFPLENTVAAINMDSLAIYGPMRDVVVIGFGQNELQNYVEAAAKDQGRVVAPETTPERGYYFRSDHFNFAKAGVPALFARSGYDHIDKGEAWGKSKVEEYVAHHYHQPSDEYNPDWDLRGAVLDLQLYFKVGYRLSQEETWPNWLEGSEFKAVREQDRGSP